MVLDRYIDFESHIKPICIEWLRYNETIVSSGQQGYVPGWGKNNTNKLHFTQFETLSNTDCIKNISSQFKSLIGTDKYCITSSIIGDGLCKKDNGSGFVISRNINNIQTYFLLGVLNYSLRNSIDECDSNQFVTFTNIQFHAPEIQSYELTFKPR